MGLLQECPACKKRFSLGRESCLCGFKMKKSSGKTYWIEFYEFGRRKRERIGPNKEAAQQRLRDVLKARTEERYIEKDPAARLSLGALCSWYLELPEVKVKDSYRRDKDFIGHLKRVLGDNTKIRDITTGKLESYQTQRLSEDSPRHLGEKIRPATVNKEVTCLKTIFNRAVRHKKLLNNPIQKVGKLPENNVRDKDLTQEEFNKLLAACPAHIQPMVEMAYYMPMRKSEIVFLKWGEVDLAGGFIRLPAPRTKTESARAVPIHPKVAETLKKLPRGLHTARVFLLDGEPFYEFRKAFRTGLKSAGITDFLFHDLRHVAINNLRKAGNDYFKIMGASGHKTMSCFKRYNKVTEAELKGMKWTPEAEKTPPVATNMDTNEKGATAKSA